MSIQNLNLILDIILIIASIWMVLSIRDLGGVVGRGLNLITIGAVVLGVAHLEATLLRNILGDWNSTVHRGFVLVGFIFLIFGFRRITKGIG